MKSMALFMPAQSALTKSLIRSMDILKQELSFQKSAVDGLLFGSCLMVTTREGGDTMARRLMFLSLLMVGMARSITHFIGMVMALNIKSHPSVKTDPISTMGNTTLSVCYGHRTNMCSISITLNLGALTLVALPM